MQKNKLEQFLTQVYQS